MSKTCWVSDNGSGYHIFDSYDIIGKQPLCSFFSKKKAEIICNLLNNSSFEEKNILKKEIVYTIAQRNSRNYIIAISDVEKGLIFKINNKTIFGNRICIIYDYKVGEKIINLLNRQYLKAEKISRFFENTA
ncbi:MAG TPA: hypothetical protein VMZ91_10315 [Candidatus Paceibacterota bacterium]|nr:hypothetical protein [Candidatus Paceibacterota bacterium]